MNDFDALLAELAPLAKSMAADGDGKIAASAAEAGAQVPGEADGAEGADGAKKPGEGEEDDDAMMGKSFQVTMPDGSTQDAYDGTEMMKALAADLALLRNVSTEQHGRLETSATELAKALQVSAGLFGVVKTQGELLKSLQAKVNEFGAGGRGRQATLSVLDKPGASAARPAAASAGEIMAKAMDAYTAGKITSGDIARLESHLGRGNPAPDDLVARLA